ncbi:hypothetical protein TBK1r_48270 [Stieleria magnilauensis]|uniref:Twin-arginine translocation signal domain-containing protein n=1 Tax=Stieleria magnilauensis TaxID=2527963 RepID=A0ABX5XVL1_9BACT|nr:hypothetical protein TBK1r_48270 [Planctomycetes bacterium TBK1r]
MDCVLETWEAAATEFTGLRLAAGCFPRQQGHPEQIECFHNDSRRKFLVNGAAVAGAGAGLFAGTLAAQEQAAKDAAKP